MVSEIPQCPRRIWTGVYMDVDGLAVREDLLMLFTVADSESQAEGAFERHIAGLQDDAYEITASERTTRVDFLPGEMPLHVVTRLHQLGYKFVYPMRESIEETEIADLVSMFLHHSEE